MKKLLSLFLALLLIAALSVSALAEVLSEAAELIIPEEDVVLGGVAEDVGYADFVGEAVVSAAEGVEINRANFPDDTFREYVSGEFDTNNDGVLSEAELAKAKEIDVSWMGIASLKGVEYLTALTVLNCNYNALEELDVSHNTALIELYCQRNELTTLDVSMNTDLERLTIHHNMFLDGIDVSNNKALESLYCYDDGLKELDVSNNPNLKELNCGNNELKELDISHNPELYRLECYLNKIDAVDITNCPLLREIAEGECYIDGEYAEDHNIRVYEGEGWIRTDLETKLTVKATDLSKAKLSAISAQTYTGSAIKPAVTVKLNGKKLRKNTDYTLKYSSNVKVGKATVTVKGKGNYTGTVKATFKINPKKVSGLKLKAGKKKITVSWKKNKTASGYQVQYASKKDFTGAKKVTVKKAATVKTTLKSLKAKKTYYVRIRAYKKVGNTKYYSKWSSKKKVKTK